jgi:hypothetical protein
MLDGRDIAGLGSDQISRLGVGRSYQKTNIFLPFTVFENARLAAQSRTPYALRVFSRAEGYTRRSMRWRRSAALESAGLAIAPSGSPPRFRTASSASSKSPCASPRSRACCCSTSRWPAWGRTSRSAWWN